MTILMWDKPKKAQSTKDWVEGYGFEDGPAGGYQPNMSTEDANRWKAKLTGVRRGFPQVEIRKSVRGYQLLVIVNLGDGYNYKYYTPDQTSGTNVHVSANGPLQMTWDEMEEFHQAVSEARAFLEARLEDGNA